MLKREIEKRVLEHIEKKRTSIVELLKTLISIPSVTGDELEIQKFIERKLKALGLEVDVWTPDLEELKKHPAYLPPDREYKNRPS